MNKLILSLLAFTLSLAAWANPSGKYHVTHALLNSCSGYLFSNGEEWELISGDDADAWNVDITVNEDGTCSVYNLLDWEETLNGTYDTSTGKIVLPVQTLYDTMGICGGIKGYTTAQALMSYIDAMSSWVTSNILPVTLRFNQEANTIGLETPILTYYITEDYEGYVGYVYGEYSIVFSGMYLEMVSSPIKLTVNEPAGVKVLADTEDDIINVYFDYGKAQVDGAQYIRIYNVDPYLITSVKVNGKEIAAEEGGEFYFIEVTPDTKTLDITVEEQEAVQRFMWVKVEGLEKFEDLVILDKNGESGKVLATKDQLVANETNVVYFTNLDLPLMVYGTWVDGTDYKMVVSLDGKAIEPFQQGPTSALFKIINVVCDQFLKISLTGEVIPSDKVTLTVNEAAGVKVIADTEVNPVDVIFSDGKTEVKNAQYIRIYNVEPYIITSVKVNGEEIAAEEVGSYYFIEITPTIKTIDITVEEQEVVELSMMVVVEGLDKFDSLSIFDKRGENSKPFVRESQLKDGEAVQVYFTNLDLPLQVYGTWADGTNYKMTLTMDEEVIVPVQEGPTSAQFVNIEPADGSVMTISLKDPSIPNDKVTLTVNEAAGVKVIADTEDNPVNVNFSDGKAEVKNAQYIRIYNVDPYLITSVKVNGEEIAAEEGGSYYVIEITPAIKTIDITVEEQEVSYMYITVTIEGLEYFEDLKLLSKYGEAGYSLAEKYNFKNTDTADVWFTNLDLPMQVYGSWSEGKDYEMTITLDGEVLSPSQVRPTSKLYMGIDVQNAQFLKITLDASKEIIKNIQAAAQADRQSVNTVRTEWERIFAQAEKDYPAVYVTALENEKTTIDTKLNELSAAIDAAESTAVNTLQDYETPSVTETLEEINGLISAYQTNVKAAYDKTKADADAAVAPDRQTLQTLKDRVEQANLDYSAYVNKTEYNALIKSIDDWNKKVTEAYNNAVNNGTAYITPWNDAEIAALENSVDDFVQRLIDAKESDTDQQRVEEITKAANADREKVQSLHADWEQVLSELNEKYPGFTLAFDKANIDTKFSKVSSEIDAAQKKAIDELSTYVSPSVDSALSEIRGLIEKYQLDVEAAVEQIKRNAEEAANADRTTVSNAKQVAENAINATDSKYSAFVIEADRNAIYSRYEKLMSDIENAYNKAVETLSTYVSPSVAQALVEIDAMVTKYQRDVAAAAETAKTEATKQADADRATLTALSEQVEQINAKYGPLGCIDTQKVNAINASIQALRGKIDSALSDVYTVGSYKSPLTASDLQKIREDISALEADCKTRLDAAIDKAAQADRDKVSSLKTQYDNLIGTLEKDYDSYRDLDQEKAIAQLFETITERINQAAAKAKADTELYVSPDVDNYLKNTITAQMNAYYDEVIEKASGSMTEAEKAAQRDKKILTDLKKDLDDARVEYAQYVQYVDESSYESLCDRIEDWKTKVDQAKEDAKETGEYTSPWTESQLTSLQNDVNGYINALRSEKQLDINIAAAAQADRRTLEDKKKVLDEAISETNRTYPAFANSEAKTVIDQMFSALSSDIDQAEQDALQERSNYSSPSVSDKLADIESRVNQYTGDVSAAADRAIAEANTQAGVDRELLSSLKSQVETTYNTYNELNCIDQTIKETKNSIDASIKELNDSIQPALNAVYTKGYYRTPWTDATIDGIRNTIGLFKGACEEKYKALVKEYADSDRATVAAKQEEYLTLNADVHKVEGLLWEAQHEAMERNIAKMFTDILEVINKVANEATQNAEPYNNEEVQSFLQAIDDEIKAYKQSLINQITVNEALTLNESEKTLQDIYEFYHELYEELLEENGYNRLVDEVQRLIEMLNQAGETALNPTIAYDGSEVAEEIKIVTEDINSLEYTIRSYHYETVLMAANEDLVKLSEVQSKFNTLIESLDREATYNGSRNYEIENKVKSMLAELPAKIDQEVVDAIDNHHAYNSLEETFEEILSWMEAYEKLVKGLNEDGLTDDEIDSLVAIESEMLNELENRLEDIYQNYEEYLDMEEYQNLCEVLDDLRESLENAREEAYNSHQYATPWDNDEIENLRARIDQLEKDAQEKEAEQNGIAKVEADPETEAIYYDLNGRLIKNPAPGKLYIRIVGGKAKKVIL